jgi:hypothetical protein
MKGILAILIFLLTSVVCLAQEEKKIPVAVQHTGKDQVGQSVAFEVKEAIRASQSFSLVDHEPVPRTPRIVVYLVSIDVQDTIGPGRTGLMSAVAQSIVYFSAGMLLPGIFIEHSVSTCGSLRVEWCAKGMILPSIDQAVEILRKRSPSLWKTL